MVPAELDLLSIGIGSVSAPAGCGKTHLIVDAVRRHYGPSPILVLTHTNAGVAALRGRLERAQISREKYRVYTIDGWVMRLIAMFPNNAGHDPAVLDLGMPNRDYPAIRHAADTLLSAKHLDDVIASSYERLIVDEYQDCLVVQHRLIEHLARVLPTVVLGDPLQAIFGFANNRLVEWADDVETTFPIAGSLDTPHRWIRAGNESFGRWLLDMRAELLAGRTIDLHNLHANVSVVALDGKEDFERKLRAGMTRSPIEGGKVLVIAPSLDQGGRLRRRYASRLPGAVVAEAVDMSDLVQFGANFRLEAADALDRLAGLAEMVMTNISAGDFVDRVASITAGRNRNPPNEAEASAISFLEGPTYSGAASVLENIAALGGVSVPRPAILEGGYALLRSCEGGATPAEAAVIVRERSRLVGRPLTSRTVGSTLLLKGLEAEVAVLLDVEDMDSKHLYVAMTRGSHRLVICSAHRHLPRR